MPAVAKEQRKNYKKKLKEGDCSRYEIKLPLKHTKVRCAQCIEKSKK